VLGVLGTHEASELLAATWVAESLEEIAVTVVADGLQLRFSQVGG
jgi:hypothetical protein